MCLGSAPRKLGRVASTSDLEVSEGSFAVASQAQVGRFAIQLASSSAFLKSFATTSPSAASRTCLPSRCLNRRAPAATMPWVVVAIQQLLVSRGTRGFSHSTAQTQVEQFGVQFTSVTGFAWVSQAPEAL